MVVVVVFVAILTYRTVQYIFDAIFFRYYSSIAFIHFAQMEFQTDETLNSHIFLLLFLDTV